MAEIKFPKEIEAAFKAQNFELTITPSLCIKKFGSLATSSFHLQRDAIERRRLTHVYMSLLREDAIKPEERSLVLQSIFSRADTGLIRGDGPTMPETGITKVIGALHGKS